MVTEISNQYDGLVQLLNCAVSEIRHLQNAVESLAQKVTSLEDDVRFVKDKLSLHDSPKVKNGSLERIIRRRTYKKSMFSKSCKARKSKVEPETKLIEIVDDTENLCTADEAREFVLEPNLHAGRHHELNCGAGVTKLSNNVKVRLSNINFTNCIY